jgi:hypothetical protein
MALQQLLSARYIVVNNACVGSRIKNILRLESYSSVVSGQIVNALVNVLVKTNDPLQVLKVTGSLLKR